MTSNGEGSPLNYVGCVGSWVAWVAWVHKILACVSWVAWVEILAWVAWVKKNEVRQKNGMGLNTLLFNHTL